MSVEAFLLGISFLFFLSILACKAGYRFGVPILLLFLGVGMACGSDGLGIEFANFKVAQAVGSVSLCVILFSGGMDTKVDDITPVLGQGLTLATAGVVLTAFVTGITVKLTFDGLAMLPYDFFRNNAIELSITASLLLGAMMSSTDSASVFSILRSKGLHLKHNLRPMLELESGSNDPMAYMLTITLISLLAEGGQPDYLAAFLELIKQLLVGALAGLVFGKLSVWVLNRLQIDNASLYPIMVVTVCIFIFSASFFLGGNSYLAVYLGGVVVGNSRFVHKRSSVNFFDGLAWLCQLVMFLALGLLVTLHELLPAIVPGIIISVLMIIFARPISVFICLAPFRMSRNSKYFISWVGLRGAVPIIFAILALSAGVPQAQLLFNVVFVCTLISLIVQGTSLAWMAKKLALLKSHQVIGKVRDFDMEFSDDIKSVLAEVNINEQILKYGNKLLSLPLPENCVAVLMKRADSYFVPNGKTELKVGDKVLLISDDNESLMMSLAKMGISPVEPEAKRDMYIDVLGDLKELTDSFKISQLLKF